MKDSIITISKSAASMTGTTADLKQGDKLNLWQLLHALMLPSGNDAALSIAEYVGK